MLTGLLQVEVRSGEEDEEILFKERAKLYRWDRELNQWKERGVGDIKILFHPVKKSYRLLMRREQVFKVCANHTISPSIELKPMNTSANALVWTATDYSGTALAPRLTHITLPPLSSRLYVCPNRGRRESGAAGSQVQDSRAGRVLQTSVHRLPEQHVSD